MTNSYYNASGNPAAQSRGTSATVRSEFAAIAAGFDLLATQFPGLPTTVFIGGVSTGVANAYVLTPTTAITAYTANTLVIWSVVATNTAASTININGKGLRNIKTVDGADLPANTLVAGTYAAMVDNGTEYRLLAVSKAYVDTSVAAEATIRAAADTAETAARIAADLLLAPLASPPLTGIPTAPTAALGTNTNQIATMAAIAAQVFAATLPSTTNKAGYYIGNNGSASDWYAFEFSQNPATTTGLIYGYNAGNFRSDNVVTAIAAGTIALTASATNYVEVSASGVSKNTTGFTSGSFPLAQIVTSGAAITSVTDKRSTGVAVQPSAMVLLASVTASNSATVSIEDVFTSTYDAYVLQISGVAFQSTSIFQCKLKVGGSYLTSGYVHASGDVRTGGAAVNFNTSSSDTIIPLTVTNHAGDGTVTNYLLNSTIHLTVPAGAGVKKIRWDTDYMSSTLNTCRAIGSASAGAGVTAVLTGIRFNAASGNITTGTFRLYGLKNS